MNNIGQQIADILIDKYGAFLTIDQLAEALSRSPKGFRISLQQDSAIARQLDQAKTKLGRRVYFNVVSVAEIMTEGVEEEH